MPSLRTLRGQPAERTFESFVTTLHLDLFGSPRNLGCPAQSTGRDSTRGAAAVARTTRSGGGAQIHRSSTSSTSKELSQRTDSGSVRTAPASRCALGPYAPRSQETRLFDAALALLLGTLRNEVARDLMRVSRRHDAFQPRAGRAPRRLDRPTWRELEPARWRQRARPRRQ